MADITKGPIGEEDLDRWDGVSTTFTRDTSTGGTITLHKVGAEVDALVSYGASVNFTGTTITSALTAIGTTNKCVLILRPGTWTISANSDWSAYTNVTFKVMPGALLSHSTYTMNIPNLEAGPYTIFSGTGAVTLSGTPRFAFPEWFVMNAVPGTTNMTTAIQYAINTTWPVKLAPQSYLVSSALTIAANNVLIQGTNHASKIITNSATADIFTVSTSIIGTVFRDLTVDSSVAKSAGWAFNMVDTARSKLYNVHITNPEDAATPPNMLNGIYFNEFDNCLVSGCYIGVSGVGIQLNGDAAGANGVALFISGGTRIVGTNVVGSRGIYAGGGTGGVYVDETDISAMEIGIQSDGLLQPITNRELFLGSKLAIDACGTYGINTDVLGFYYTSLAGTWVASNGVTNTNLPGIRMGTGLASGVVININGARIYNNGGDGIVINDGGLIVTGSYISNNGIGASGGHGINLANSAIEHATITGNVILDNGTTGGAGYGIYVAGLVDKVVIQSNQVRLNQDGDIYDAGTVNHVVIDNYVDGSIMVASATTITLPATGSYFTISGTTQIDAITASWIGRIVTLKFESTPTVTDGVSLRMAGNLVATAEDTLTLVCDGTLWYEVSRSVN